MPPPELEAGFPNLRRTGYTVTSPPTRKYNCIAWAADDTTRWWWPDPDEVYYWPGQKKDESVASFLETFGALGYQPCDSRENESGYEKVALYVDEAGNPTHMARQLASGEWTSKCGGLDDIIHTLEGLEGQTYGTVAQLMRRPFAEGGQ